MKVSDYLPDLYKNNLEMNNLIHSEENELETNLKPDIDNSFNNTFINTANELGISQYENLFNIKPNKDTESLDLRRERIRSRLVSKIPFTETYMINSLNNILGEGNWTYEIDYNNYTLEISSIIPGRTWLKELYDFLDRTIPCNIDTSVEIYAATWQLITDNYSTWDDIEDTDMTWEELMNAEWLT